MADGIADDPADRPSLLARMPDNVEFRKRRKRLNRLTAEAISRFAMAQAGERWLVCLSGGKDSWAMLGILTDLQTQGLLPVDLLACNLDQGQPGFPAEVIPDFLAAHGLPHRVDFRDTYSLVVEKVPAGATYCALCSRLRRGNLYRIAREEGCAAIALGHHREDILETFFLNLFYGGKLAAMAPSLMNDEGDVRIVRPLSLCAENDLARYAAALDFPIIPCDLCGSQDGLKRQEMKQMLANWQKAHPGRTETIFRALGDVKPDLLLDREFFRKDSPGH